MKNITPMERDAKQELQFYLEHVNFMFDDARSVNRIKKAVKMTENETIVSKTRSAEKAKL